jgi:integrase
MANKLLSRSRFLVADGRTVSQWCAVIMLSPCCPKLPSSNLRICEMQPKKPLTDRGIRALPAAPKGKRKLVWDALVPGFAVRITDKGQRSFVLVTRYPGSPNPTPRTIGTVGAITLEDARGQAREWLKLLAQGIDPAQAQAERQRDTLRAICTEYLERDGAKLRSSGWRRAVLERLVYPTLGSRPITSIRRSDIVRLLDKIEDERGGAMADRTLAVIGRIMNYHAARTDDFRSPIVRGMARAPSIPRDRILTDEELRAVWRAAGEGVFGSLVRFLLLSGARRNEAAEMTWAEITGTDWVLPASRNKTKLELARPLSKAAQAILAELPRLGDFVFTRSGKGALGGITDLKSALDQASGTNGWTLHDLRRTARSLMSRAGVPSDHAERCLGHVIGGVRGVYDRHAYREEMLIAYEKLAALIAQITDPRKNVVAIRGQR